MAFSITYFGIFIGVNPAAEEAKRDRWPPALPGSTCTPGAVTNLGISVGTARTGAIVVAALSSSILSGVQENPAVPEPVKSKASTERASENETARIVGLRAALSGARRLLSGRVLLHGAGFRPGSRRR